MMDDIDEIERQEEYGKLTQASPGMDDNLLAAVVFLSMWAVSILVGVFGSAIFVGWGAQIVGGFAISVLTFAGLLFAIEFLVTHI